MTRALILGATALMLWADVASAQAVYVNPGPPGVYLVPPTLPVVSGYDAAPTDVAPPLYDYAPVPTTESVTAPKADSVTAPKAPVPTMKWVTAPQPGPSNK